MATYTDELLPCTCFGEFCDVVGTYCYCSAISMDNLTFLPLLNFAFPFSVGLLEEISTPATFIADVLLGLGNPAMSN